MPRLRRADVSRPGLTLVRAGRGFSYRDASGTRIDDPLVIERLRALVIPPAWNDGTEWHRVSAADINDSVRPRTRADFTAKDLRTLQGTVAAAREFAAHGPQALARVSGWVAAAV